MRRAPNGVSEWRRKRWYWLRRWWPGLGISGWGLGQRRSSGGMADKVSSEGATVVGGEGWHGGREDGSASILREKIPPWSIAQSHGSIKIVSYGLSKLL